MNHDAKGILVREGGGVESQGTLYRCRTCDRIEMVPAGVGHEFAVHDFVDPELEARRVAGTDAWLRRVWALLEGLAGQQAMPDESWRAEAERLLGPKP